MSMELNGPQATNLLGGEKKSQSLGCSNGFKELTLSEKKKKSFARLDFLH